MATVGDVEMCYSPSDINLRMLPFPNAKKVKMLRLKAREMEETELMAKRRRFADVVMG